MCFSKTIKTNVCNYGRKPLTAIGTSEDFTTICIPDGHLRLTVQCSAMVKRRTIPNDWLFPGPRQDLKI